MPSDIPGFQGTEMPDAGWWEALWPDPATVLSSIGVRSGMDVIDLCCGNGWFTQPLAKVARRVFAIDIDPALLEVARHRLTEAGFANCAFIVGDAYDLVRLVPVPADYVYIANALHDVADRLRLARAVHGVLKPGGHFSAINWHPRPRSETTVLGEPRGPKTELRMSADETAATMAVEGLQFVRVVEVPPYHYGSIFMRAN